MRKNDNLSHIEVKAKKRAEALKDNLRKRKQKMKEQSHDSKPENTDSATND